MRIRQVALRFAVSSLNSYGGVREVPTAHQSQRNYPLIFCFDSTQGAATPSSSAATVVETFQEKEMPTSSPRSTATFRDPMLQHGSPVRTRAAV
jgi:hypothetical protein